MPWYAAHAIMYCQFKDGEQGRTPVWENVLLIQGPDGPTAMKLAEERARLDEGDSRNSMTWDGRPARWVFAGIRKLMSVAHESMNDDIGHGDELTYSEFILPNLAAVEALAKGEAVRLYYCDEEKDAPRLDESG